MILIRPVILDQCESSLSCQQLLNIRTSFSFVPQWHVSGPEETWKSYLSQLKKTPWKETRCQVHILANKKNNYDCVKAIIHYNKRSCVYNSPFKTVYYHKSYTLDVFKGPEEDIEEIQEATVILAAAQERRLYRNWKAFSHQKKNTERHWWLFSPEKMFLLYPSLALERVLLNSAVLCI